MKAARTFGGSLVAIEFLSEAVREFPGWTKARTDLTSGFGARLRDIRRRSPARSSTTEARARHMLVTDVTLYRVTMRNCILDHFCHQLGI